MLTRNPVKEPKIGDRWKSKFDNNYCVTIVSINTYIKCKNQDDEDHEFTFDWFELNMLYYYEFINENKENLIEKKINIIIEKQKELIELINELKKELNIST